MATTKVESPVTGVVWKITAAPGAQLGADDPIILVESMKMEIPITMPRAGRLLALHVREGDSVAEGQAVADIE